MYRLQGGLLFYINLHRQDDCLSESCLSTKQNDLHLYYDLLVSWHHQKRVVPKENPVIENF